MISTIYTCCDILRFGGGGGGVGEAGVGEVSISYLIGCCVVLFNWLLCCLICTIMPVMFGSYLSIRVYGVLLYTVGLAEQLGVLE